MLTLHRAALVLPDPADPTAPSIADGAVVVRGELVEAVGPYGELAAAHPSARARDWGTAAVLTPGLRNPWGQRLLERDYHPDPREEIGVEPVVDGLVGCTDETRYGASARRGLQRMLGFGVTAVAGPFERAAVRTAVARSGLAALPGASDAGAGAGAGAAAGAGSLDPLAVLPLPLAVHGRVAAGGRADFAVFPGLPVLSGLSGLSGVSGLSGLAVGGGDGVRPAAGGCLATVLGGRLVYRRR
ncbi:imidazolonepropionase-like domain-containing protein [Kitasatospora aureofaciens]|uniref:imidazolonepropionase-like domain-containing protein n=1 Tax=Kitasatospora aureofaciens TaxID=1894 RepID=UPI0033C5D3CB